MEFQGYAIAAVVLLLLAYVAPYMYRRRVVLGEARIDERYSEDLRMLELQDARQDLTNGHRAGSEHGTVFYRRPEVMMSNVEESRAGKKPAANLPASNKASASAGSTNTVGSAGDIRLLAKDRARRHARIAKRGALQKRGMLGGGLLGVVAIIAWALALTIQFPVIVGAIATGLVGVYLIGFSYLVGEISKANAADEAAIEEINAKMSGRARGNVSAGSAVRKPTVSAARGTGTKDANAAALKAASTKAKPVVASEKSGGALPKASTEVAGTASVKKGVAPTVGRSGISMSMDPEIISDGDVVAASSAAKVEAEQAAARAVAEQTAATAAVPSYTLKPRAIERRVVAPYRAPEQPTAAVPYRPKQVGERLDSAEETAPRRNAADGLAGGTVLDQLLDRRRA